VGVAFLMYVRGAGWDPPQARVRGDGIFRDRLDLVAVRDSRLGFLPGFHAWMRRKAPSRHGSGWQRLWPC